MRLTLVFALVWAVALSAVQRVSLAQTPEADVLAADNAFNEARRNGLPLKAGTLDDAASETSPDGVVADAATLGGGAPLAPVLSASVDGVRAYRDVAVLFGTANLPTGMSRYLRIWVKREMHWRLLTSHLTMLMPGILQPRVRIASPKPVDEEDISSDELTEAEQTRLVALRDGDRRTYETLVGDDYGVIDGVGLYMTKAAEVSASATYTHRVVQHQAVDIVGPAAVVRGLEGTVDKDGSIQGLMQFTRVWVKRAGRMECVAQASTSAHAFPATFRATAQVPHQ